MKNKLRLSIRYKFLIPLLVVTTVVLSTMTVTMSRQFHLDKKAYVQGLNAQRAMLVADQAGTLLNAYHRQLEAFGEIMVHRELPYDQKIDLLERLFDHFDDFLAVTLYRENAEPVTVYDDNFLASINLSRERFLQFRQAHPVPIDTVDRHSPYLRCSSPGDRLSVLTLACGISGPHKDQNLVVAADIHLQNLARIVSASQGMTAFITTSGGVPLVHSHKAHITDVEPIQWVADLSQRYQRAGQAVMEEFRDGGVVMFGGLVPIRFAGLLAGVQVPKSTAYLTARELLKYLMVLSSLLFLTVTLLSLVWSRRISKPLKELSEATGKVAKGDFDIHLKAGSNDEIGDLGRAFNQMAGELSDRDEKLRQTQAALIQSEKMAAFGQLGAGIAHEVKNPLAAILGLTQLCVKKAEIGSAIAENLSIVEKESRRCKIIIDNLLKFARQEKVEFRQTDINQVAEDSMTVVRHQLAMNGVRLVKKLDSQRPMVVGDANQIQQVLVNLMINAQQAMNGKEGVVQLVTQKAPSGEIQVSVTDNGPGIPEEIREKIFEPFFTTKPSGKGTGLGLSVSYGLIQGHKASMTVNSKVGKGTSFVMVFPKPQTPEHPTVEAQAGVSV